jgi:hypothetical protein
LIFLVLQINNLFLNNDNELLVNFEKDNIKNIKINYNNDISTLLFYIEQMDKIYSTIDHKLFDYYKNPTYVKVSMQFFNEVMKKDIEKMHNYLNIFDKYILFTTYSLDLKDIANEYLSKHNFDFSLFEPKMKYFDIALNICDCINKYYKIKYQYYWIKVSEETNNTSTDIYTFSNLIVSLQNINPHYSDVFNNYYKSYINNRIKAKQIPSIHYVPVDSYQQFRTYLSFGNYNNQIRALSTLVSRFVQMDYERLNQILSMSLNFDVKTGKTFENNTTDLDIYNELRESRIIKDKSQKDKRNIKRANEILKYIILNNVNIQFNDS